MPFVVAAALTALLHLAIAAAAWQRIGLLADDHAVIGAALYRHQHGLSIAGAFLVDPLPDLPRALYRPFLDLAYWLESAWFGTGALGYHVVNSALHCGTALLWFLLVRRWSGSAAAGLATALLFVGWPGHGESLHWIAAASTTQSVFLLSLALLLHDTACQRRSARAHWSLLVPAGLVAALAVGSKESAIHVLPLAAVISWLRRGGLPAVARRGTPPWRAAVLATVPMAVAVFGWLWWRASRVGTWGSGSHYGWRLENVGAESCGDWVQLLLGPLHGDGQPFGASALCWLLVAAQVGGLALAVGALRRPGARRALAPGGALLALGYVAGVGLGPMHVTTLQDARYTYEPALGLCAVLGVGIAALPARWRGAVLAAFVALFTAVLAHNREPWLEAGDVYAHMRHEVNERARTTAAPVRVLDAPSIRRGAFVVLNSPVDFFFWQRTAPPGIDLRGRLSSRLDWQAVLRELAQAAAGGGSFAAWVVQQRDGALLPFTLDRRWPARPADGVTIGYARIAGGRPARGSPLAVEVLITTKVPLELVAEGGAGAARLRVEAGEEQQALQLAVPWGDAAGAPAGTLTLRGADGGRELARYGLE